MPLSHTTVHNDDVKYNEQKAILKPNSGTLCSSLFVCFACPSLSLSTSFRGREVLCLYFFLHCSEYTKQTHHIYCCTAARVREEKKALTKTLLLLLLLRFFRAKYSISILSSILIYSAFCWRVCRSKLTDRKNFSI